MVVTHQTAFIEASNAHPNYHICLAALTAGDGSSTIDANPHDFLCPHAEYHGDSFKVNETRIGYFDAARAVVAADGLKGLFGRGLKTRIIANGAQGLMFSILWKLFMDLYVFHCSVSPRPKLTSPFAGGTSKTNHR